MCFTSVSQGGAEQGRRVVAGPPLWDPGPPALPGHVLCCSSRKCVRTRVPDGLVGCHSYSGSAPGAVRLDACLGQLNQRLVLNHCPRVAASCRLVHVLVFLTPPCELFSVHGVVLNCYFYSYSTDLEALVATPEALRSPCGSPSTLHALQAPGQSLVPPLPHFHSWSRVPIKLGQTAFSYFIQT